MNIYQFPRAFGKVAVDGGGSATVFSALAGGRWNLLAGELGYTSLLNSCTVSLYEIDSSQSSVYFRTMTSATSGVLHFNYGPIGAQASATTSRLVIEIGTYVGSFHGAFSGYYVGS